jgi:hypothetical protein
VQQSQSRPQANFEIKNLDREGKPLRIGDRVGFIMRGWFLPREQESFGIIASIDSRGGIKIDAIENYRRFTTSGFPGLREKIVYFTHHVYDPIKKVRVYAKKEGEYLLSIFRVDSDELEWHLREAEEGAKKAEAAKTLAQAAARAAARKGR